MSDKERKELNTLLDEIINYAEYINKNENQIRGLVGEDTMVRSLKMFKEKLNENSSGPHLL